MTSTPPTALILAGGRSSRFGSEKSLHVHQGKPLVRHVLDAVRIGLRPESIVIGAGSATGRSALTRLLRHEPGVAFVDDAPGLAGPLAGLTAALTATRDEGSWWLFACACDMPSLSPTLLKGLWGLAGPGFDAVVPYREGRFEPLCAFYRVEVCCEVAARYGATGRRSLQGFVEALPRVKIVDEAMLGALDPNWAQALTNVNRLGDLGEG